jgi:hypothetical protein
MLSRSTTKQVAAFTEFGRGTFVAHSRNFGRKKASELNRLSCLTI